VWVQSKQKPRECGVFAKRDENYLRVTLSRINFFEILRDPASALLRALARAPPAARLLESNLATCLLNFCLDGFRLFLGNVFLES
jgi:hypothetical protein